MASGKWGRQATMSAAVRLVCIRFSLVTYMKDILWQSTKTNSNRFIEFVCVLLCAL